jgi:hypothetical protein
MYKTILKDVQPDKENPNVPILTFVFDNGIQIVEDIERGLYTMDSIVNYCREKINILKTEDAILEQQKEINDFMANPPLGVIDTSFPQPTQEELDQEAYQIQREALILAKQDLDLGLITQDDYNILLSSAQEAKKTATKQ